MENLIQLNTTRNGRDKVFRTLQYALKAINGSLPYLASEKSRDLEKTLASFRKLLRLGTFIDALHGARQSIHHADLLHGSLITLSRIANAMYLLGDHIVWLHKVQYQLIIYFQEHGGPENLKKVQAKKFVKSNKSISQKKFLKICQRN